MHDRPIKPLDLAIYWIEFVIRHNGAPHLRVAGVDIPWYKYLFVDILIFIIVVSVIMYILCSRLCFSIKNKVKVA